MENIFFYQPSFSLPRISKSVKCKTTVEGESAQGLKTFLFHNPPLQKSSLRKQMPKSKSASTSQKAEECSKTGLLKMQWCLKKQKIDNKRLQNVSAVEGYLLIFALPVLRIVIIVYYYNTCQIYFDVIFTFSC